MTFAVLSVDGKGTSDAQKTAQKEDILVFIKPYYKRKVKRTTEKDTISYQSGKQCIPPPCSPWLDMRFTPVVR